MYYSNMYKLQLIRNKVKEESVIPSQLIKIFYIWRLYGIAPATLHYIKTSSSHYYISPSRRYAIMSFIFFSSLSKLLIYIMFLLF